MAIFPPVRTVLPDPDWQCPAQTHSSPRLCVSSAQSLKTLSPEKLEALISELGDALDAVGESRVLERGLRNEIKTKHELDDLQMAVAVQWVPKERIERSTRLPALGEKTIPRVVDAEALEIERDPDIASFARLMILADEHAEAHPPPFNYAFRALSRDGAGHLRMALLEGHFADIAEADAALAPLSAALVAAREAFA